MKLESMKWRLFLWTIKEKIVNEWESSFGTIINRNHWLTASILKRMHNPGLTALESKMFNRGFLRSHSCGEQTGVKKFALLLPPPGRKHGRIMPVSYLSRILRTMNDRNIVFVNQSSRASENNLMLLRAYHNFKTIFNLLCSLGETLAKHNSRR